MSRPTRLVGLLSTAVVAVVATTQLASASTPPTVPPGTELGTPPIPTDIVRLVDDTGTITVEVPSDWNDVDTAPDGSVPSIVASSDRDGFLSSFDIAGVKYRADRRRRRGPRRRREPGGPGVHGAPLHPDHQRG